jgi:hemerythrin superfamily protein
MATTNGTDIVAMIRQQHTMIRQLFDGVQQAAPSEREEAFLPLGRLLAVHETAEEEIVYPSLRDTASDVVEARKAEEDEAKKAIADLEKTDPASDEFATKLAAIRQAVEAHAEQEEATVLPLLAAQEDPERREKMASAFATAEKMAPTHAHAGAPESAAGNMLVGPFVAMVDKVRDAIHDARRS